MKSLTQSIPGYRIHEYMVVLHPPAELREKIGHLRKDFSEKYRTNILTPGKTHIMLAEGCARQGDAFVLESCK
ncbi:MAG: hypothetical protein EOO01_35270 [Chitinophagaceae bacterium]|nr:MAG: hypothetical protein EOO01_35270 [Chitinophagaceae bacterium]